MNDDARVSIRKVGQELDISKSKVAYHLKKFELQSIVKFETLVNIGHPTIDLQLALLLVKSTRGTLDKKLEEHWLECPFVLHYYPLLGWQFTHALVLVSPRMDDFQVFVEQCPFFSPDVISTHILIPIIRGAIPEELLFKHLKFLSGSRCECSGCRAIWNRFLRGQQ